MDPIAPVAAKKSRPWSPELGWFVVVAFAISWSVAIPAALAAHDVIAWRIPPIARQLANAAPTFAALLVGYCFSGRDGIKNLSVALRRVKQRPRWYAFVIVFPLGAHVAAYAVFRAIARPSVATLAWDDLPIYAVLYVPICLLQEEIGWRGFFLDRLLRSASLGRATLVMALTWGLWHLPTYLADSSLAYYGVLLAGIFPVSATLAWLYDRTQNLWLCALFHGLLDVAAPVWLASVPADRAVAAFALWVGVIWVMSIPVLVTVFRSPPPHARGSIQPTA